MARQRAAQNPPSRSPYLRLETYSHFAILVAILIAIAWIGWWADEENRAATWLVVMILMAAFLIVTGRAITESWRGILIDSRNKMSLSRLQIMAWSVLVLSALLTGATSNVRLGTETPLNISVPSQLWIVMGISTASLVTAPALLRAKPAGMVVKRVEPTAAEWSDLFKGEETGNAANVDFAKLQMFFFTFVLILGYGAAVAASFRAEGLITSLPRVDEGMYVLLGISNTGYLASKAVTHTD
ncbi:MAG: hypothetical protein WD063_07735 [Pirellulales bacterium]